MSSRRIIELGDPLLRAVSVAVTDFAGAVPVLEDLRDTLYEFRRRHGFGRGIAAVQIGKAIRAIFIEIQGTRYEILNPVVTRRSGETFRMWDDCFSFPNLMVELERQRSIEVEYQDREGVRHTIHAEGDFSELLQHEIDHLDGILSIDRALDPRLSFMTRSEYLRTHPQNILNTP